MTTSLETPILEAMKTFNTTGLCVPNEHYMTDLTDKLEQVKALIDARSYFTINRARQYGKTTMLSAIRRYLSDDYLPIEISFEGWDDLYFESPKLFCPEFLQDIYTFLSWGKTEGKELEYARAWLDEEIQTFKQLSRHISKMCANQKVILMIDEVDKISNNRVFLQFISMLRDKFLARGKGADDTFNNVILVGVYDIKNIKLKLINEGLYTPGSGENKLYNSPWNIAINFKVDMSFSIKDICSMLSEYETDHHTKMDIAAIAKEIYEYTSGYPYLVSNLCKYIDEDLDKDWSKGGVQNAVKLILKERSTLFDDLAKNLENDKDLRELIYELLMIGTKRNFQIDNPVVQKAHMFGFIKESDGKAEVSNRIFEIRISDYFISKKETGTSFVTANVIPSDIIEDGRFNMELCITKFAEHYLELYNDKDEKFIEREARLLFLTYLKPLINGKGFYHIESGLTDIRKMDIVVDFLNQQFIIELKIWHGQAYQDKGYEQLAGYLEKKAATKGYMLTFQFLKDGEKKRSQGWKSVLDKKIFEVVV